MALMGIFGIFVPYLLYFGGINYASPADAQILNNTWQIFAIFFAFFILKEKMTLKKTIAVLSGFVGVIFILRQGFSQSISPLYFLGLMLALGSAVVDSLFYILGKKLSFETWFSLTVYYIFAFLSAFVSTVFFSSFTRVSFINLIGTIYVGMFGIALPIALMFRALKLERTSKIISISYLSPFLSLLFISIFLHDEIYFIQIIGLLLITIGIVLNSRKD